MCIESNLVALQHKTHAKGWAYTYALCRHVCIDAVHMNPTLDKTSALQHLEHSNLIKVCNKINLNSYATITSHIHLPLL